MYTKQAQSLTWSRNCSPAAEGKLLFCSAPFCVPCRLYQQHADVSDLASRTELSFAAHNKGSYALEDDVVLHLDTKNAGSQVTNSYR